MSTERHNIRAGAASKAAMDSDPATKATLQELRKAKNNPEVQAALKAQRQAVQELANALREIMRRKCGSLAAKHFPRPKDIEDWEELARIVEIPKKSIGELTLREIYDRALEWAEEKQIEAKRKEIAAKLVADVESSGPQQALPQPTPKSAGERQLEWLAKAMLTVRGHPDWSDAKIAEHVGKHPGTLSRSKEYQTAAKLARESKTDRPKGFVTKDPDSRAIDVDGVTPDSGAADVEEADPPTALADDCSDRGKPIPGSRYVREYCAQCKAKIRVTPDKVGTKPLCEECAK